MDGGPIAKCLANTSAGATSNQFRNAPRPTKNVYLGRDDDDTQVIPLPQAYPSSLFGSTDDNNTLLDVAHDAAAMANRVQPASLIGGSLPT